MSIARRLMNTACDPGSSCMGDMHRSVLTIERAILLRSGSDNPGRRTQGQDVSLLELEDLKLGALTW